MSRPPAFKDLSFEAATAAADKAARLLLVDVTAEWCEPCKQMDRTTWVAPEVVRWLVDNTVAIQVDADTEAAAPFRIQAVPTIIAFRAGAELDRVTGSRPAVALLEWLEGLSSGQTEHNRMKAAPRTDLRSRLNLSIVLFQRCLDDESHDELACISQHALEVDESWVGVRHSFLIAALAPLVERSTKTRERFAAFRDLAQSDLSLQASFSDWVTLNQLLGDEQVVAAWAASITPDTARQLKVLQNRAALDILAQRGAWTTLGQLISDPLQFLREEHDQIQSVLREMAAQPDSREMLEQASGVLQAMVRNRASMLIRALAAVGRRDEALAVASEARSLDPSPEMDAALTAATGAGEGEAHGDKPR